MSLIFHFSLTLIFIQQTFCSHLGKDEKKDRAATHRAWWCICNTIRRKLEPLGRINNKCETKLSKDNTHTHTSSEWVYVFAKMLRHQLNLLHRRIEYDRQMQARMLHVNGLSSVDFMGEWKELRSHRATLDGSRMGVLKGATVIIVAGIRQLTRRGRVEWISFNSSDKILKNSLPFMEKFPHMVGCGTTNKWKLQSKIAPVWMKWLEFIYFIVKNGKTFNLKK